jgi:hypothetical protein
MPNRWTEFVKAFAAKKDLTYGCALSTPACKEEYKKMYGATKKVSQKKERETMGGEDMDAPAPTPAPTPAPKENITFKVSEKKKGRKPKYATDEERKAAKRSQTLASNAKKRQEKEPAEKEVYAEATAFPQTVHNPQQTPYVDKDYPEFEKFLDQVKTFAKNVGKAAAKSSSPLKKSGPYQDRYEEIRAEYVGYINRGGNERPSQDQTKSMRKLIDYIESKGLGRRPDGRGITEACDCCGMKECKCDDSCSECSMEGAGVFSDIVKGAKKATQAVAKVQGKIQTGVAKGVKKVVEKVGGDYTNALLYGRNDYSPKVRAILDKYGGEVVRTAAIVRNPVQQVLVEAMNVVSFGQFKKNMKNADYDELFHLQLDFTLESGKEMRVEKVEVINMDEQLTNKSDGQIRPITKMPIGMTLNAMMESTKNAMGGKFFLYSAKDNNCQDFLLAVLTSNGMGDEEDYAFVKQNTAQLFKGLDTLRKVSNTLTDIGSKVNIATTGAGISGSADVIHHHHHYHHSGDDFSKVMNSISSGKSSGKSGKGISETITRKGRFEKGSPEAAAFMKSLRDKRQSKKE